MTRQPPSEPPAYQAGTFTAKTTWPPKTIPVTVVVRSVKRGTFRPITTESIEVDANGTMPSPKVPPK